MQLQSPKIEMATLNLGEVPTEILELICHRVMSNGLGSDRCSEMWSTICVKYTEDRDKDRIHGRLEWACFQNKPQILQVCRRLRDVGWPMMFRAYRWSCLQAEHFMDNFASHFGESNLRLMSRVHLRLPQECRLPGDESSVKLTSFLVHRMPGLETLELSKRWYKDSESTKDEEERETIKAIAARLVLGHCQLKHMSWTETTAQPYPNDDETDPIWVKVTATLRSRDLARPAVLPAGHHAACGHASSSIEARESSRPGASSL